jgi:tripartite-type tricarboxylate transporter receptor subunit TctC
LREPLNQLPSADRVSAIIVYPKLPLIEEAYMSVSARRKSVFEGRPAGSKLRQTQRRLLRAAALAVDPFGVNAAELARRKFLHLAAGAATLPAISRSAEAQTYPTRPITMIVPVPAGGPTDAVARVLAERMRNLLGQPIIIQNESGVAGGSIGLGKAAHASPDGYTIDLGGTSGHVLNGAFYSLPYDVLNDFVPISPLVSSPTILLAGKTIWPKDLNELVPWLRANPNKVSAGFGAVAYRLLALFFQKETRTQFTLVPYRGGAPALQDLAAGQIELLFGTPDALPQVRAGIIKAYAVANDTRSALAPDVPTFAEMGLPALSFSSWYAFFAPKGTPKAIIDRLNGAAVQALADPRVRSRLGDLGFDVLPHEKQTPETLGAMVKADAEKWWPLIKEFGIKAE